MGSLTRVRAQGCRPDHRRPEDGLSRVPPRELAHKPTRSVPRQPRPPVIGRSVCPASDLTSSRWSVVVAEGVLVDVLGSAERLSSSSPSSSPSATARPSPDAERAAADQAAKSTQPSSSSSVQAQTQNHTSGESTVGGEVDPSSVGHTKAHHRPFVPRSSAGNPVQTRRPARRSRLHLPRPLLA